MTRAGRKRLGPLAVAAGGLALSLTLTTGCVYFNTFYLARRHFADAEYERLQAEQENRQLPQNARQSYQRSLEFAAKVLADHPESKWVEEALLISQKVLYRQGELAASIRKAQELQENFPESSAIPESRLYFAMGLAGLEAFQQAAAEAAAAAEGLTGERRAEALLVQSRALVGAGRRDEATSLLDRLIEEEGTPPEIALRARLYLVDYYEAEGAYGQASQTLRMVLADPALPLIEKERVVPLLIEFLLKAGERAEAETWIARLEAMNADGYFNGLLRYFRARLIELDGATTRARDEMVLSLGEGVTAQWEARIRLELAQRLERDGMYMTAGPEYQVFTQGLGTEEQKLAAARRYAAITRYFTLRSLAARAEGFPFSDPRNIRSTAGQQRPVNRSDVRTAPPPRAAGRQQDIDADIAPVDTDEIPQPDELGNDPPGIYLLLLAEHLALEMSLPDSAAAWIDLLEANHPGSPLIPRALYAMQEWFRNDEATAALSAAAAERLRHDYRDSRWTYYLLLDRGEPADKPAEILAEEALRRAEQVADPLTDPAAWAAAVDSLRAVAAAWPGSQAGRQAELQAARLLELGAGPLDSARVAYERVIDRYPETTEAFIAMQFLGREVGVLPPDPLEARAVVIAQEGSSWATWFSTRQAARITRLQPRQPGQRTAAAQPRSRAATVGEPPPRP